MSHTLRLLCASLLLRSAAGQTAISATSASMSSTYDASGGYLPAEYCIDGNTGGHLCHTITGEDNTWLELDLGGAYAVTRVEIYNRGSHPDRLGSYEIWLGNEQGVRQERCYTGTASLSSPWVEDDTCIGTARFVTILLPGADRTLNLHEVTVYGTQAPLEPPPPSLPPPSSPRAETTTFYITGDNSRLVLGPEDNKCTIAYTPGPPSSLTSSCPINQPAGRRLLEVTSAADGSSNCERRLAQIEARVATLEADNAHLKTEIAERLMAVA